MSRDNQTHISEAPKASRRALLFGIAAVGAVASPAVAAALLEGPAKADGLDWPAIILRAEGLIDDLRNYYAKWTTADEERAAQVLKYCRDRLAGLPEDENETEFGAVVDFIEHHNQSLDWMIYGDPVSMIAMLAARSSRTMLGAGIDPIYAAIKHERDAYAAYCIFDEASSQIGDKPPRGRRKAYQAWRVRFLEREKAHSKVYGEMCDARADFLQTQPTSVAGLRAFINHIDGPFSSGGTGEALWDELEHQQAFPTLAAATRNIIGRGQA